MTIGDHLRPLEPEPHSWQICGPIIRVSPARGWISTCRGSLQNVLEPFERDDGIHPVRAMTLFPRYNEYLEQSEIIPGRTGPILQKDQTERSFWLVLGEREISARPRDIRKRRHQGSSHRFHREAGADLALHLSYIKTTGPIWRRHLRHHYGPGTYPPVRCKEKASSGLWGVYRALVSRPVAGCGNWVYIYGHDQTDR